MQIRKMIPSILPLASAVLWVTGVVSAESVVYVDSDATGTPDDGSSWCNAFVALDEALNAAAAGTTIRVADGTYTPDTTGLSDPREAAFQLVSGVTLEGGYAGCDAADPNVRDVAVYQTILSGDLNGDDEADFANNDENCYHVVVIVNADETAVLDGFTVTAGNANGPNQGPSPDSKDQGSGVNNYFSTPRLINCTFERNWASNHGSVNDHGGATLINCTFRENYTGNIAGGLYIHFSENTVVTDCAFYDNVTAGEGGGIYNKGSTTATLTGCTFSGNQALHGGGMYNNISASPTLTDCTFAANEAHFGGGMYNAAGSSPALNNCTFSNNRSNRGAAPNDLGRGGGMFNAASSPVLTGCTFEGNSVPDGVGGAIYNAGNSAPTLTNCAFSANTAGGPIGFGAAIYSVASNSMLSNCTFVGNLATGYAGGMYLASSSPTLTDCTFRQNEGITGGALYITGSGDPTFTRCVFIANSANSNGAIFTSTGCHPVLTDCWVLANTATGANGPAGGIGALGGALTMTDCVLSGNTAGAYGGALHNVGAAFTLTNCTISNNVAGWDRGGGVYTLNFMGISTLVNCILWGNHRDGQIADQDSQIYSAFSGTHVVNHTCVQGLTEALGGVGNVGNDPLFVDADGPDDIFGTLDDDVHLMANSPCIDAGDNSVVTVPLDLDGNPRIANDVVDMGAYEFTVPPLCDCDYGDVNHDGTVDLFDLFCVLNGFSGIFTDCTFKDVDLEPCEGDGDIDLFDLFALLNAFAGSCPCCAG